jgi:hypothetical protein
VCPLCVCLPCHLRRRRRRKRRRRRRVGAMVR